MASDTPCDPSAIKFLSPEASEVTTPSDLLLGSPLGSLNYCAPEVLKHWRSTVCPRVTTRMDIQKLDVFAAGVVTFVMLSGKFPFHSKSGLRSLAEQIERGPRFDDKHWEGISEDAKEYCRWLMHTDRKKRPFAHEALSHPWLKTAAPQTPFGCWENDDNKPVDEQLFDDLRELDQEFEDKEPSEEDYKLAEQTFASTGIDTEKIWEHRGPVLRRIQEFTESGATQEALMMQHAYNLLVARAARQCGGAFETVPMKLKGIVLKLPKSHQT